METATAKIKQPINIISKTVELPQCDACVTRVWRSVLVGVQRRARQGREPWMAGSVRNKSKHTGGGGRWECESKYELRGEKTHGTPPAAFGYLSPSRFPSVRFLLILASSNAKDALLMDTRTDEWGKEDGRDFGSETAPFFPSVFPGQIGPVGRLCINISRSFFFVFLW